MDGLNYTQFTENYYAHNEAFIYNQNSKLLYRLLNDQQLSYEELLWFQAFESFSLLSNSPYKDERLASEIRRYIFLRKMGGHEELIDSFLPDGKDKETLVYVTDDGNIYNSLIDEGLINKMIALLQQCYKDAHLSEDETAYTIPTNPNRIRRILIDGTIKRRSLIRLAFALKMDRNSFHEFISGAAYLRKLSSAVPSDLILLYCIENEIYDWRIVVKLQNIASEYIFQMKNKVVLDGGNLNPPKYTDTIDDDMISDLLHLSIEDFCSKILKPCCHAALYKSDKDEKQYSATAFSLIHDFSILSDVSAGMANCTVNDGYHTVYLTNTVLRYGELFPINVYGIPRLLPGRVMSQDLYCRFLAYRIMVPNPPGKHTTKLYSMKYGILPHEIADNVLMYSEIISIPQKPHRIDRYDIIITLFYSFIMKWWSDPLHPLISPYQNAANNLWFNFFNFANEHLDNAGYEMLSFKNPLDALLRLALHSLNALECYTRVYELNVLASMIFDTNSRNNYPEIQRYNDFANDLLSAYRKLNAIGVVDSYKMDKVIRFCQMIKDTFQYSL